MKELFSLRIPIKIKRWLEQEAQERGLTVTGLILAVLSEYKRQVEKS